MKKEKSRAYARGTLLVAVGQTMVRGCRGKTRRKFSALLLFLFGAYSITSRIHYYYAVTICIIIICFLSTRQSAGVLLCFYFAPTAQPKCENLTFYSAVNNITVHKYVCSVHCAHVTPPM